MSEAPQELPATSLTIASVAERAEPSDDASVVAVVHGARVLAADLVRYVDQQERHAVKTETHWDANERIRHWTQSHAERARSSASATVPVPARTGRELAVPSAAHPLVGRDIAAFSATPLEDMRREQGLDGEREEIYERLRALLGLKAGMRMLEQRTRPQLRRHARTMRQVNALFPDLTATEIALFPLLERVPDTILNDAQSPSAEPQRHPRVTSQLEFRVDGIAYGDDATHLDHSDETDMDSALNPRDREIVRYRAEVHADIERLVILTIELPRLLEIVQESANDALTMGTGLLQREALQRHREREAERRRAEGARDPAAPTFLMPIVPGSPRLVENLAVARSAIRGEEADRLLLEEQAVADRLLDARVMQDGSALSLQQLTYLIGLLQDVPRCLLSGPPFQGTVQFRGTHVLFADEHGTVVEAAPLSAESTRLVRESVIDESQRSTDRNVTMQQVGSRLTALAQTDIFGEYMAGRRTLEDLDPGISRIEAMALRTYARTGVGIEALSAQGFQRLPSYQFHDDRTAPQAMVALHGLKIGREETEQLCGVLDRLGPGLLQHVGTLRKRQTRTVHSVTIARNQIVSVEYSPDDRSLTLFEPQDLAYSQLPPEARAERSFLTAYGCARSVWQHLPDDGRRRWQTLHTAGAGAGTLRRRLSEAQDESELFLVAASAVQDAPGPHPSHCVTPIGMEGTEQDFCAHFACYVVCQEEFAHAAAGNQLIADKHADLKRLIDGLHGTERDFREGSMPLALIQGRRHVPPGLLRVGPARGPERRDGRGHGAGDDKDREVAVQREAEKRDAETLKKEIKEAVLAVLDGNVREHRESVIELLRTVFRAIQNETPDVTVRAIRDYAEKNAWLLDHCDGDPADEIIASLAAAGLLEPPDEEDGPVAD